MAYFAYLDGEKIKGWYCDDVHDTIPTPNVEVTEEVWQQALNRVHVQKSILLYCLNKLR